MAEDEINIDQTEDWENSIDKDGGAKLKFPIILKEDIPIISEEIVSNIDMKRPIRSKRVKMDVIDTSKRNKRNKGLF